MYAWALIFRSVMQYTEPQNVLVTGLSLSKSCLVEGKNISIHCTVQGFPRPSIIFMVNDTIVTPGDGIFENYIVYEFYNQVKHNTTSR